MQQVLRLLLKHPQPTCQEIADTLGINPSRASQLVAALEVRGLVRRTGKARSVEVLAP